MRSAPTDRRGADRCWNWRLRRTRRMARREGRPRRRAAKCGAASWLQSLSEHLQIGPGQRLRRWLVEQIRGRNGYQSPNRTGMGGDLVPTARSEEHTSELQSLMRISYAGFGLKKKNRK